MKALWPHSQCAALLEAIQVLRSPGTHKEEKLFEGKNVGRLTEMKEAEGLHSCIYVKGPVLQGMLHSHLQS